MKRLIYLTLIAIMLIFVSLSLFACGDDEADNSDNSTPSSSTDSSVHYHEFDMSKWIVNDEGHYNPCPCHPEIINLKEHVDLVDRNGICDVCAYVLLKPDTYTVKIVDTEGNPVVGAELIFRSNTDVSVKTDEKGQASVEFTDVSGVNLWITSLPEGYQLPERDIFPFKSFELTVTVNKIN